MFRKTFACLAAFLILPVETELTTRPYLDLAENTPSATKADLDALRLKLQAERKSELERLKREEQQLDARFAELQERLKALNRDGSTDTPKMAEKRTEIHCAILSVEKKRREKRVERHHGVPVAFDNKLAKLDLIEQWPARRAAIRADIATGRARLRPNGNIDDIGVREISKDKDQQKDIKLGEDALRELKMYSLVPPEVEDKRIKEYVQRIADRVAANSDLKVPVKLTVLHSQEINAFALPGGLLFVNTGLIERAESESELAGVIAHELAHVSARHGAKLMKRANIAGLIYQVAQIATIIATGGIASIGAYYLFQAGFLGLGLVLDLSLLGVSREYEAEADQLGAQYAWKSGYDPRGFITFFDKMAAEKGYVKSASFFRTHPPFFERILATVSEIEYLPRTPDLVTDSSAYRDFKAGFAKTLHSEAERKKAPTLKRGPECPDDTPGTPPPAPAPPASPPAGPRGDR